MNYHALYDFWFGEGTLSDAAYVGSRMGLWFGKNAKVDAEMRALFAPWLEYDLDHDFTSWKKTPKGQLSLVLLLDQVPRNCFRDTPRAFAFDARARAAMRQSFAQGLAQSLHPIEAIFLQIPLEHSESARDQKESVERFQTLLARTPGPLKEIVSGTLDYSRRHAEVISRFGRFPHRNKILGRPSTRAEIEFLKQPGSSF